MRSIINRLTAFLCLCCFVTACKKEEKLSPTEEKENVYGDHTLPQGNHAYDADILQLFQKYNTLFLYKYVPHDLYYSQGYYSGYTGGTYDPVKDSVTRVGYFDVPANEAWIGQQLNLLKEIWMKFYPDAVLKAMLPKKVFLLDSFYRAYPGPGKPLDNWPEPYDTYQGEDFFAVTWGGPRINTITTDEKYAYKSTLNIMFLSTAYKKGLLLRSPAFTAVTSYAAVTRDNFKDLGLMDYGDRTPDYDWIAFMTTIVTNSYAELTASGGVLHSGFDTKGMIRKKYDIMLTYFLSAYGVDLQAIGNAGK
jgi:hypothetical protein